MIDIRELRIGNLVTLLGIDYNHGMTFPDPEGDEPVVVDLQMMGLMHDMPNRYAPIPITPEWLDKNNIVIYEQDSDLFNLCCVKQNGVVLAVFSRPETQVFVHSLQNIIYSITGRELTIKP